MVGYETFYRNFQTIWRVLYRSYVHGRSARADIALDPKKKIHFQCVAIAFAIIHLRTQNCMILSATIF